MESTSYSSKRSYRLRRGSYGRSRGRRMGVFTTAVNRIAKRVIDRNEEFKYVTVERFGANTSVSTIDNLRPQIISGPSKYANRVGNGVVLKNMDLNLTVNCTSAFDTQPFPLNTYSGLCRVTVGRFRGYRSFDTGMLLEDLFYLPSVPSHNPSLAYCHASIRPENVECLKDELYHISPFTIPNSDEDVYINPASLNPSSFGLKYHHRLDVPISINSYTSRSSSEKDAFFICIQLASFFVNDDGESPLQLTFSYTCRYSYTDH